jgi:hypothetical protein
VPCPDVFVQDVPSAVRRRGLEFADFLDPRRAAVLDDAHCVRLNHEAFFFADAESRDRFVAEPLRWCGLLTDPVTKRRFRPGASSESVEHAGVTYWFEMACDADVFAKDPEMYRLFRWVMEPKAGAAAAPSEPAERKPDA